MKISLLISLILLSIITKAQSTSKNKQSLDSAYTIPLLIASYAKQFTGADMADRFGANNNIGGSFMVKTRKNWIYGFKGNFLWGGKVRLPNILSNITTSDGYVIDNQGKLTTIYLGQRGSSFFALGGRLFNVLAPNKNSGIIMYGGFGMLQHKISIKFQDVVSSLSDAHKKGYDRLSFGYAVNSFIGYLFLSKNRLLNFFGGFDVTQGWTKSVRKFNYDTKLPDTATNSDLLYGVRIGWIIRFNKRQTNSFYYN